MNIKRQAKIFVDVIMLILFLYLAGYRAGKGLFAHGTLGLFLFVVFIIHHVLNIGWYKGLAKGRYGFRRLFLAIINFLLLIAMLLIILSSIMISGMIFDFSPIRVNFSWISVHFFSTAWGFTLMCCHLGVHISPVLKRIERKFASRAASILILFVEIALLAAGLFCFCESGLPEKMIMNYPIADFYTDTEFYIRYSLVIIGVCMCVHFILRIASEIKPKADKKISTEGK